MKIFLCTEYVLFLRALGFLVIVGIFAAPFSHPSFAQAGIVDDLTNKIAGRTEDIKKLEEEIMKYQEQLTFIGKEKDTLNSAVQTLDVTRRKLSADISLTEKKIGDAQDTISVLSSTIADTQIDVDNKSEAIGYFIRKMYTVDELSPVELVLSSNSFSDIWNDIEILRRFEEDMNIAIHNLLAKKEKLESDKQDKKTQQQQLVAYESQLSDQKTIADQNRAEKNTLLQQTKNQESAYQTKLVEKQRLKEAFEKEILDYEYQIKVALDPNAFPAVGSGVLAWPLSKITITQYFGSTPFSKSGAYNGKDHNGLDLGIPVGTPLKASLSGTVWATGNTDVYAGCYSYGKWVLIKHYNGLTTLYAHLSLVKVVQGQTVDTGEIIGYTGNTGYSTGPHLHFGVYATQGVQLIKMGDVKKNTNCGGATVPVASLNAYMNPLDYLANGNSYR